jgi:hypothetical protein
MIMFSFKGSSFKISERKVTGPSGPNLRRFQDLALTADKCKTLKYQPTEDHLAIDWFQEHGLQVEIKEVDNGPTIPGAVY